MFASCISRLAPAAAMLLFGKSCISFATELRETMNRREDEKSRRGVIRVLCSVLALVLISAGAAVVLRPSESPSPERIRSIPVIETGSINPSAATIGFADSDLYGKSPEDINRTFDLMSQTGVSTVRIMVPWAFIQPTPDQWDWGVVDTMVNSADGARYIRPGGT